MTDYETLRQQHRARANELAPQYLQHLWWPRERIDDQQASGLRRVVAHAREHSRWHAGRLEHVDAGALTLADLRALPVMTKADLMQHWDEIVTDPRLTLQLVNAHLQTIEGDAYLLDSHHAVASGGSSGVRGVFAWDWDGWAHAFASGGGRWNIRFAMSKAATGKWPPVIALIAASAPTHMSSALAQTFGGPPVVTHRFPVTMPMRGTVAGLNAAQPTALAGYASALNELATLALRGDLRISPLTVAPDGEPLLPEMRATMEKAWAVPVGSLWGTSEGCVTGASCFMGDGMHLSEEERDIIEPVDAAGQPVPPGELSAKILLTNLINSVLPLIRYEITDQVRVLDEPCPCGATFARVDDIQGRTDDVLLYDGGIVIHPHVYRSPLSREPAIVEYQVRQTPAGADIAVRTSGEIDVASLRNEIAKDVLVHAGLPNPVIEVTRVDTIERTVAGKLKRFVPL